jgi:hypothetical protein
MEPEQKRSLQDIMPPQRRRPQRPGAEREAEQPYMESPRRKRGGVMIAMTAVVLLLLFAGAVFGISSFFESAVITVVPHEQDVAPEGVAFEATKSAAEGVVFSVATTEKIGVRTVPASGTSNVEKKASGTIIVYNYFSTTPQRLIKNTRFETTNGLIFRTPNSITIPGMTTTDGKETPGSLEIVVEADEAGEKYNIDLTDFTVPGFSDTPQYDKIYARSKTPMSGGFVGTEATVSEDIEEKNRAEMRTALTDSLKGEAMTAIPDGYTTSDSLIFVTHESQPSRSVEGGAELREKGVAYAILIPIEGLARIVAESGIATYDGEAVSIMNPEALVLGLSNPPATPWTAEELSFSVSGSAHLVWTVDSEGLKRDLAGKDIAAHTTILASYPSVDSAKVTVSPIWRQTFPADPEKITVTLKLAETE